MHKFIEKILEKPILNPKATLFFLLLVTIPSFYLSSKLSIESDFKRLLPQDKPSVVALDRIIEKVGGVGVHQIRIESEDPDQTIAFIEDLVVELKKLPPKYVRVVDYHTKDVRSFFEERKYFYVETQDIKDVKERLDEKIKYEKLKANPFFFDLEDDEVQFDISDIEEKYKKQAVEQDKYYKGYLFSEDQKLAVVMVHPSGATTGTKFSKDLVSTIDETVQKVLIHHPSITVHYSGKFLKVLSQYQQLIQDIISTLAICLFFVSLVIYLYFKKLRVIILLAITLAIGASWAFALAKFWIGSLNSQTAFLGSIIIGNGVNSGIFLISRYLEELRKGSKLAQALITASQKTYFPTFIAALTTSTAFAALSFSEITGMSEFGYIGGVGMILCWLASFTFLPAVLVLSEGYVPMFKDLSKIPQGWLFIFKKWSQGIQRFVKPILVSGSLLIIIFAIVSIRFIPHALEYDFSNLQNKYKKSPTEKLRDQRANSVFGQSLNPSVILLDNVEQGTQVCDVVMHLEDELQETDKTIESCSTIYDFVPREQEEKMKELASIRALLSDDTIKPFYKKNKKEIDELRATKNYKAFDAYELPDTIQRKFQEKDGTLGRIAFVYNRHEANINNGKKLIQLTDTLTDIHLADGSKVSISGDYPIFADLLRAIETDGPKVSWLSFLFVLSLIAIYFRRLKPIMFIGGSLVLAVVTLFGIQSLFGIRLNFFNYIALPVTFGIGVDYTVNLFHRYEQEGKGYILKTLEGIGGAIVLCSLTTIIGYISLTTGINQALVSFGWLALIGEFACIFSGLFLVPAWIYYFDQKKL